MHEERGTSESGIIAALERSFGGTLAARVAAIGIGDDAAVLRTVRGPIVWTIDTAVDGTHFDRRLLSLSEVGARSFHAAVSDLAAMGGRPLAALSNLVVPRSLGGRAVRAIAAGQARAARELGCPVVGGNLAKGEQLSVTTTALGTVSTPLLRSGARVGDELWLIGDVGLAAAGLRWLTARSRTRTARTSRGSGACVRAWRRPRALVREGRALVGRATAAIDVSDGLAGDAAHVAEESGARLVIEEGSLRAALRPELLEVAEALGVDPLMLALAGGEDYALLATGPARARPRIAHRIGRVERGRGVRLERHDGSLVVPPSGFDHFSGRA